jgi:hypothetical protein
VKELLISPREESRALEKKITHVLQEDSEKNRVYVYGVPGTGKSITTWSTMLKWVAGGMGRTILWVHLKKDENARVVYGSLVETDVCLISLDSKQESLHYLMEQSPADVLIIDAMNEAGVEGKKEKLIEVAVNSNAGKRRLGKAIIYVYSGKHNGPKEEQGGFTDFEMLSWSLQELKDSCIQENAGTQLWEISRRNIAPTLEGALTSEEIRHSVEKKIRFVGRICSMVFPDAPRQG